MINTFIFELTDDYINIYNKKTKELISVSINSNIIVKNRIYDYLKLIHILNDIVNKYKVINSIFKTKIVILNFEDSSPSENYLRKNLNSSSCGFIIKKLSELSPDFMRDAYLLCLITDKNRDLDLMFKNIHDYNKTADIVYPLTLDGYYEALTDSSCKSLFLVEGNSELITIDELKKTIDYISEVVRKIKRHNLSPLEEIIYAYDISKNRIYLEEGHDERKSKSRDITKVLFGDKIVCTGFEMHPIG